MEKVFHSHGLRNHAGTAILKSDKIDLKLKVTRRDKKGHLILIKGRSNPNHITALNTCVSNTGVHKKYRNGIKNTE